MTAQAGLFVARDAGGNGTTAKAARLALGGLLAKDGTGPLNVRKGVLADGQGAVVTGAAGMTYNVRPFVAVTMATAINGPVLVPNDATVSVTTDPAPGSNSRIDVIYVWQRLVSGDGGSETTNAPIIDVAKGNASATPSAPAIPTGALELARVTVPSGTTATSALTFTQGPTTSVNPNVAGVPVVRSYIQQHADAVYSNGQAIGSIAIPALSVAQRVVVTAIGLVGNSGVANQELALNMTSTNGTTINQQGNRRVRVAETLQYYGYSNCLVVDLPANSGTTINISFSTIGSAARWVGSVEARVLLPGEYA